MQYLGLLLGFFLGPRGSVSLVAFVAVELVIGRWFGAAAAGWAALAILLLAMAPVGMNKGRAGVMRAFQAMLALMVGGFSLLAFVMLMIAGFRGPQAWFFSGVALVSFFAYRGLGLLIARSDVDTM